MLAAFIEDFNCQVPRDHSVLILSVSGEPDTRSLPNHRTLPTLDEYDTDQR